MAKGNDKSFSVKFGRGSVYRAERRLKRIKEDPEYAERMRKISKKSREKRKRKINNRCIDCNKLIHENSTRCNSCSNVYKSRGKK